MMEGNLESLLVKEEKKKMLIWRILTLVFLIIIIILILLYSLGVGWKKDDTETSQKEEKNLLNPFYPYGKKVPNPGKN